LENNESKGTYTFQTDFSYIFKDISARMELGAKSILGFEDISTFSETRDTISGSYFEDTLANFDYAFRNEIHSLYGIFGQELGKFKYQFGLRGEYAVQEPNLMSEEEVYFKTYANLFPSGHIKYLFNDDNELSVSYSRRINRPRAHHLNPFTSYADPLNLRQGNPLLDPEYINSFDLGYSFTGKKFIMSASVFHRITKDVINRVKIYRDDNSSILTRDNIDESIITGGELILIIKPFKWWKNTISGNLNHTNYIDSNPSTDWNNSGVNWGVKYAGSFDFWKKTASLQVNWNYHAPRITPQGVFQRQPGVTIAFEKRLFDKKFIINAKVTDIFNVMSAKGNMEQPGIIQNFEYKWLTRRYYLTLSYRFGKNDSKLKAPKSGGGGGD
jgi:outer membrane receptor protein involved in Fe transport